MRAAWMLGGALVVALAGASPAAAACEDLLPGGDGGGERRLVTPDDLVSLRDIGEPDAFAPPPESPLAVSPDGRFLAFVISRAVRQSNSYCRGLVVLDLEAKHSARLVDRGGDYMAVSVPLRGLVATVGNPDVVTPVWSPDGRWLAYRKRIEGRVEAWIAAADGSGARRVARLDVDVERVAWSSDGRRLILASRPGLAAQARAIEAEALSGYLYDDRFQPNDASWPALRADAAQVVQSVALADGAVQPANAGDVERVSGGKAFAPLADRQGRRARAWFGPSRRGLMSPRRIQAQSASGRSLACVQAQCDNVTGSPLWIGGAVVYLRREGWANEATALYRWVPGQGSPSRLAVTSDAVHGCVAAGARIVCLVENAISPRKIARFDPASRSFAAIYDPNPEFRSIQLGDVRRLRIRNALGLDSWADLVLPPGYRGGRIPMVVVQYRSRGFLRGGVGDEYPVHAFAARGMAVLSFDMPPAAGLSGSPPMTAEEINARNMQDWRERRSLLGTIERGIDQAVALGVADPDRLGITGLSDGATSAVFALLNTNRFRAAAISSCCYEPDMMTVYGGPRWTAFSKAMGFPELGKDDPDFWRPMSLAQNAARVRTPLLIQAADREYLFSLRTWSALKQAGSPAELYVFPDEYHNKWQPAHRFAVYERSLDWFGYWLAGQRSADPGKAAQYLRWDQLGSLQRAGSAPVAPVAPVAAGAEGTASAAGAASATGRAGTAP